MPQRSRYIVRNAFTNEELVDGSFEDCREFVAKYGGWSSLEIVEAIPIKEESQDELWNEVNETIRLSINLDPYRSGKIVDYLKSKFHITRKTPNQ